jgi:hypothetical protein
MLSNRVLTQYTATEDRFVLRCVYTNTNRINGLAHRARLGSSTALLPKQVRYQAALRPASPISFILREFHKILSFAALASVSKLCQNPGCAKTRALLLGAAGRRS